ncbi:hypothetical protein OF83DRAFT_793757 [Amylostereum chailletii]|nr:hypothetical protein OF83DRAFT_793757 [Amylostereum chailletii]
MSISPPPRSRACSPDARAGGPSRAQRGPVVQSERRRQPPYSSHESSSPRSPLHACPAHVPPYSRPEPDFLDNPSHPRLKLVAFLIVTSGARYPRTRTGAPARSRAHPVAVSRLRRALACTVSWSKANIVRVPHLTRPPEQCLHRSPRVRTSPSLPPLSACPGALYHHHTHRPGSRTRHGGLHPYNGSPPPTYRWNERPPHDHRALFPFPPVARGVGLREDANPPHARASTARWVRSAYIETYLGTVRPFGRHKALS